MKTTHLLGLALIGVGIYFFMKSRKPQVKSASQPTQEPKANASGFEIESTGKKIFTPYGLI